MCIPAASIYAHIHRHTYTKAMDAFVYARLHICAYTESFVYERAHIQRHCICASSIYECHYICTLPYKEVLLYMCVNI